MKLQKDDIRKIRLYKSGLVKPFASIHECVGKLFGIQAQAQQFGEMSIFNRTSGFSHKKLKEAYENHEIIKIWGQRMTVHMYNANDWKTIHQVYGDRNNFVKKGWEDKNGYLEILIDKVDKLTLKKHAEKKEITGLIEKTAPHIKDPYRDYSVILQATLSAVIFGVPCAPQTKYFANRKKCVNDEDFSLWKKDKEKSFQTLLKTYFKTYGPATIKDFCHWSGLTKKEIERHLEKIKGVLKCDRIGSDAYYSMKGDKDLADPGNIKVADVKLLGKFDPLFVAFSDKSWIADQKQQKAIWRPAGHVEAVLILGGALAGTWRYKAAGKNLDFNIELFRTVSKDEKKKVSAEAAKIAKFMSKGLGKITYTKGR